jgi:hypothetical protein
LTDPYRRLACAILLGAFHDAAGGNGHSQAARRWLASSSGGRRLVGLLDDLDPACLDRALARLPRPAVEQLTFFDEV